MKESLYTYTIAVFSHRRKNHLINIPFCTAGAFLRGGLLVLLLMLARPAAAVNWIAVAGVNLDTNWDTPTNWSPTAPVTVGAATFNAASNAVAGSPFSTPGNGLGGMVNPAYINNYADTNFTLSQLYYENYSNYHNTLIAPGCTVKVTSALDVGNVAGADGGSNVAQYVTIAGATATLLFTNKGATVVVGQSTSAANPPVAAVLDLSGLGTFNVAANALYVAIPFIDRPVGTLYLAATNAITLANPDLGVETETAGGVGGLDVGDSNANAGGKSYLYLGQVNTINANTILVSRQKAKQGLIAFNPAFLPGGGVTATFRGSALTNRVGIWSIGDGGINSGTANCSGTNDFSGGQVDALVNTLYLGNQSQNAGTGSTASGTLTYDDGVFNVNALYAGVSPEGGPTFGFGTINLNSNATLGTSATLLINSNLYLGYGINPTNATGTLNINGGTAVVKNIIVTGSPLSSFAHGTSIINVNGGTLVVSNFLGRASSFNSSPLTSLSVSNASLTFPTFASQPGVTVSNLTINGTADTLSLISVSGTATFPGQYPVMKYNRLMGALDFNLGTLPGTYSGYISNNPANSSVDLVLTNTIAKTDVWTGTTNGASNGTWDLTAQNWLYNNTPINYQPGDSIVISDTTNGATSLTLTNHLLVPSLAISNSAKSFSIGGSGVLIGVTNLTKDGSASFTLGASGGGTFTGSIIVHKGTLNLTPAQDVITGGVEVDAGAVLLVNAAALSTAGPIINNGTLELISSTNPPPVTGISGGGLLEASGGGDILATNLSGYTGSFEVADATLIAGNLPLGYSTGATNSLGVYGSTFPGVMQAGAITIGTNGGSSVIVNGGIYASGNATLAIGTTAGSAAAPLGTLALTNGVLQLAATGSPAVTVNALAIDGQTSDTNFINLVSVAPSGSLPAELPLIQYSTLNYAGTFNLALGTLPAGYAGYLTNDTANNLIGVVITSSPPPAVSSLAFASASPSGANLLINGTNQGEGTYYLLMATDLSESLSQWIPVATNTLTGSGSFSLTATNAILPSLPQQFFLLSTTNN